MQAVIPNRITHAGIRQLVFQHRLQKDRFAPVDAQRCDLIGHIPDEIFRQPRTQGQFVLAEHAFLCRRLCGT